MNVVVVAPFPPPYGGVSVHAVRLTEALQHTDMHVATVDVARPSARAFAKVAAAAWRSDTVLHYHSDEGNWKTAVIIGMICAFFGTPHVITLHSFRERAAFYNPLFRTLIREAYLQASCIVAISAHVREAVVQMLDVPVSHIRCIASALPISTTERTATLPPSVPLPWLQAPLRVFLNVSRLVAYEGKDLYGLDVVANAWGEVARVHDGARLLIVIADVVDRHLYDAVVPLLSATTGIDVIVDTQIGYIAPLTAISDVVVRATRTEGGPSLTVEEALELGCIAVASDSVPRPAGTLLFENGDPASCARACIAALDRVRREGRPQPRRTSTASVERLLDTYRQALTR